jgi:ubiquinone/menaquinone biosynthesis C-methylase UbiE
VKQQALSHDPVFTDRGSSERYAQEQEKVFKWMHPPIIKALEVKGFRGGRILDAGCGPGYHTVGLKRAFPESTVVGIDLSEHLLEIARKHLADSGLTEGVTFQSADVLDIPFEADSFDAVVCIFMFHLMNEPTRLCNEIERVLKPEGHLVIIDLRRNWLLSFFEGEMRSSFTLPEALQIIKPSNLRAVTTKQMPVWWEMMA